MSFLVELPQELFPEDALDGLDTAAKNFKLANAQALMWMSQLAYETAHEGKVNDILKTWKMTRLAFGSNDPVTGLPPKSACFVVAEGHGATIVSFSGTDPLKIEDWIKDFTLAPEPNVLHRGFETAIDAVWPTIEAAIKRRPEQPLFFTGHSMGAALALLGAEHALNKADITSTAVYTFGSPRTGGLDFFNGYTPKLGDRTFRLAHGHDIVTTVPPSANGNFRHVGQLLHCRSGGEFAGLTPAPPDQNLPDFNDTFLAGTAVADLATTVEIIKELGERGLFASVGARLLGPTNLLPSTVRDHIPASYFQALSIPLK
ncbi:lipase family protein [Bradyrhizobium sp. CB1650]|uniref:lipase family protein n=1 Tax=Bradyrhizobium sp. CB1650 TaxID=3039153 RepID=UPI0024358AC1|nr:lipase family protein [Bradyrhizobium sp. CB1650]WGD49776.1 lipase family protein [Bradyrhizobium sp. CB1650]